MLCGMNLSHNKKINRFTGYSKSNGNYSCLFQGCFLLSFFLCRVKKLDEEERERPEKLSPNQKCKIVFYLLHNY